MSVKDLIDILLTFPQDMEVSIDYAGNDIDKVSIKTWTHDNYPYNLPDKDYVVIE